MTGWLLSTSSLARKRSQGKVTYHPVRAKVSTIAKCARVKLCLVDVICTTWTIKRGATHFSHLKIPTKPWCSRSRTRDPRTTPSEVATSTVRGYFLNHSIAELNSSAGLGRETAPLPATRFLAQTVLYRHYDGVSKDLSGKTPSNCLEK